MIPAETWQEWEERGVPWQSRLLMQVVFFVLMAPCFIWTVGVVALVFAWAVVSPLFPRSWRLNWDWVPDPPDPATNPVCPGCQGQMALGPVVPDGHRVQTEQGGESVRPAQFADCPQCGRTYRRVCWWFTYGTRWSPWEAADG